MLEVFNDVGATLLSEALEPAAVGTAPVIPQDQLRNAPRLRDAETGIIPAIDVDRMGYAKTPPRNSKGLIVGIPGYRRHPGDETAALNDD